MKPFPCASKRNGKIISQQLIRVLNFIKVVKDPAREEGATGEREKTVFKSTHLSKSAHKPRGIMATATLFPWTNKCSFPVLPLLLDSLSRITSAIVAPLGNHATCQHPILSHLQLTPSNPLLHHLPPSLPPPNLRPSPCITSHIPSTGRNCAHC